MTERACTNSGQQIEDHFVDMHEMVEMGSGARRETPSVSLAGKGIEQLEREQKRLDKK